MPDHPLPAPDDALNHPTSKADLFRSFTWLALQGFGGVLAVVQRELVEKKRWMTREQFVEDWAVAQIMPGPNVVNLSMMIGGRYFGLPGALAALAGMLAAPMVVVLLLAVLYGSVADSVVAQNALRGMGAVAAGLITATGIKLIAALDRNAMGMAVCIGLATLTFIAIALLRWPLLWVLLGIGGGACLWAYRVLSDVDADRQKAGEA
ncbi:MAG: chromate transporter [Hydrogenophaga sp.]|jgi:chromate transporter|uniref:chromate transporter n=1 Tax=Hydrogenophaga sp. TaxID=1904254 RepID=UPI002604F2A0|nr:chromate transporter [Hydrogenophaga sp.]MCV0441264.1 chromate transporter [Hydrogenophaga sp.]